MKIAYKIKPSKGKTRQECTETIAMQIIRDIRKRERKGIVGEDNPISRHELIQRIEKLCLQKKWISIADRRHPDYKFYLNERLYPSVMRLLRTPDKIVDDNEQLNPYFMDNLVHIKGVGYVIADTRELIHEQKEQMDDRIKGLALNNERRTIAGMTYVEQLPSANKSELLTGKQSHIDADINVQ